VPFADNSAGQSVNPVPGSSSTGDYLLYIYLEIIFPKFLFNTLVHHQPLALRVQRRGTMTIVPYLLTCLAIQVHRYLKFPLILIIYTDNDIPQIQNVHTKSYLHSL